MVVFLNINSDMIISFSFKIKQNGVIKEPQT